MSGTICTIILVIIIVLAVLVYLSRHNISVLSKLSKLLKFRFPRMTPDRTQQRQSPEDKLREQIARERATTEELERILQARQELMTARAANIDLKKTINNTTEKTIRAEKREVKPRRL